MVASTLVFIDHGLNVMKGVTTSPRRAASLHTCGFSGTENVSIFELISTGVSEKVIYWDDSQKGAK